LPGDQVPKYRSFNHLAANETEGVDYQIRYRIGSSKYAIVAIHGGSIEPGTTEIADAVAGSRHSFYTFSGIKKSGNANLHITSHLFDEPKVSELVKGVSIVLSIHGCWESDSIVFIGGRHNQLSRQLSTALEKTGFKVEKSKRYPGVSPYNICNRGHLAKGVQIEISAGLRRLFFGDLQSALLQISSPILQRFIKTIVTVIDSADHYSCSK
jgi:phage replication-related protein YjqB (UPF0714/DUF867 family)